MAALAGAQAASAATSGNLCQLSATATFSKPLATNPAPFEGTLRGRLDNCSATPDLSGAPTGATVEAGQIYTAPDGKQYREPLLSGSGNCLPGNLTQWSGGTLIVRWDGGGVTLLPVGGSSEGPFVAPQGAVAAPSVQLTPVDPDDDPLILTTTTFAGYQSVGVAAMQYDSPSDCASAGVKSATFSGAFGPYHF